MKMIRSLLGPGLLAVAMACSAQNTVIPLRQIEREARNPVLSSIAVVPPNPIDRVAPGPPASESVPVASFVLPQPTVKPPRALSGSFFLLNGLHLGMAVFDVEMTQHCIANHHCVEGNPLMPSSQAGQLGVNFALVGYGTFLSYKLRKHGNKLWVLSPATGIAAHTVGVATGFKNR